MNNYYQCLHEDDREALFLFMRTIDAEVDRNLTEHRQLSPPYGQIAAGAAHFDPFLRAAVTQDYLGCLRSGKTPEEAEQYAIEHGQLCVKKHNEKRPKDSTWLRCKDSGQAIANSLQRRCRQRGAA